MAEHAELLTVREAAERLRLSPKTVYRRLGTGSMPGLKLGSTPKAPVRIDAGELDEWMRGHATA